MQIPEKGDFFYYDFSHYVVTVNPTPENDYLFAGKCVEPRRKDIVQFRIHEDDVFKYVDRSVRVTILAYPENFSYWHLFYNYIFRVANKFWFYDCSSGAEGDIFSLMSLFSSAKANNLFCSSKGIRFFVLSSRVDYIRSALSALEITAVFEEKEPQSGLQAFITGAEST